ncbi:MAG: alpha/beta hydrolase [Gammaproteobacteria bacterium]|nr:alpha/beta hydrolase [Gammaproteobacteria bacterium]
MPRITVNDVDFHYLDEGQGATLLLLGGTLSTARGDFSAQIDAFRDTHRVIAPDRRGYGATRPPARDFPDNFYEREARDMAAIVRALELKDITVFGWSEGAAVALWLATLEPSRVKALVVWGGIASLGPQDIARFETRRDTSAWSPRAQTALNEIFGDGYWQRVWCDWLDTMQRLAAQGSARLACLDDVTCPVLVMHGGRDPLIGVEHPQALLRGLRAARLHEIAEGAHNLHLSHADPFNQAAREFLRDIGAA